MHPVASVISRLNCVYPAQNYSSPFAFCQGGLPHYQSRDGLIGCTWLFICHADITILLVLYCAQPRKWTENIFISDKWIYHWIYSTVVSHSCIMLRWPISNTCAKSYSILFKWFSASIFSNRVPNWRHKSLDVFRILFASENLTLSCRGDFEETKVSQKCS